MADWNAEHFWETAAGLSRRMAAREMSALETARAFTERLERQGPGLRAVALSLREDALNQARDVDRELKRGRTRGALQGVPCGVSDLLSVAGRPTTWGSALFAGQVFQDHAMAVERARKAGAVVTAKLTCAELGGAGLPAEWSAGGALNPHDRTLTAGGSGGGVAAAVAAGLVSFAIGMDSGGSLLRAAGRCGVPALRPTFGTVSRFGSMPLAWSVDSVAFAGRSVEDCGHILSAISGGDLRDPGSPGRRFYFTPHYSRAVGDLRVGYVAEGSAGWLEALRAVMPAAAALAECELPCRESLDLILAAEAASVFSDLLADGRAARLATAGQAEGLRAGADMKAAHYLRAMRVRRLVKEWLGKQMENADLIVAPLGLGSASDGGERPVPAVLAAAILAGLPMLALPAGAAGGVPVGILMAGRPRMENVLLKAAGALENLHPNWRVRPKY
jgi:aspartyl-tRNA(Asn)/glutamyl-tRNA(Gln) amidotransferase subunit A